MEIENFSLYHIGVKLKPQVNINDLKNLIKDFATSNSFEFKEDTRNKISGIFPIEIGIGTETIASKEGIDVKVNVPLMALNFIGKDPEKVSEIFQLAMKFIDDSGQYDKDFVFEFYEVIAEVVMSNSKSPKEILNESVSINLDGLPDSEELNVAGIRLMGGDLLNEKGHFEIVIEPHPSTPTKKFLMKVIRQSRDIEIMFNFHNQLKEYLEKIIE
ncbi:hypothetical protein KAT24_00100 [Candidatus Pacearchaeota archaeon]|nr:hypothetical protein [Candidatus Pacearchaeota archaeon]